MVLLAILIALPVLTWLLGLIHGEGKAQLAPWKYCYSVLVYCVCLPGIFAAVLCAYSMFFIRQNMLEVNLLVYVLPLISMALTLVLIGKRADFNKIPGFDRLSGFMIVIGITFAFALAIQKTFVGVFFWGSFQKLGALIVGVFVLLQWGTHTMFRRGKEAKRTFPKIKI